MTRYRIHASRAAALTQAADMFERYRQAEHAARGTNPATDSLDYRNGRILPLAQARTTAVARYRQLAGMHVLEVPSAGEGNVPDDPSDLLVDRSALSAAVQDALDANPNPNGPPRNPGGQGGGGQRALSSEIRS